MVATKKIREYKTDGADLCRVLLQAGFQRHNGMKMAVAFKKRSLVQHLKEQFQEIMEKFFFPEKVMTEGPEEGFGRQLDKAEEAD